MSKETIAQKKNRTLIGLIMKSPNSGAIYYWKRGDKKAEVIAVAKVQERKRTYFGKTYNYNRPKGMKANFNDSLVCIIDNNKIIVSPTHGLGWVVLKEIHLPKKLKQ